MIEQGGKHLFEPHRNGAATGTDGQYILLQIGNVASVRTLRREGWREHTLHAPETSGMILEAGKRRIASKEAV
jgi:hypothetical protein